MMSVKILGFGSNWWARYGRDPNDGYRYTRRAAYYNSAGVRCGQKIKRHWVVSGVIRFNGIGDFDPHFPGRAIGQTFDCSDLVFACGGNRILFVRRTSKPAIPDWYLVVVSSERFGIFDFEDPSWKSESTQSISVSQLREQQEAMLLMKGGEWVRNSSGTWRLMTCPNPPPGAALQLLGDVAVA
ncbi:MAG: hypothetical protein LAO09_21390 [Acidobacteriia bacterium]|nr:hypothetical protein [Terriglobia bacterium]